MTTALVYDEFFLNHRTGAGHPERRERLTASLDYLKRQSWFERVLRLPSRTSEPEWVQTIHEAEYLRRAEAACRSGAPYLDVPDVRISAKSYEVALHAAGAGLELADRLIGGQIDNGFALLRPPGHHAEAGMALGFCLLNNVAILARYLQKRHRLDRIFILDWDVHHGNGTQHAFEEDPSVFYVSLHQYPYYPGTGAQDETGVGRGQGSVLNCPMPAGSGDREYERAFRERILPAAQAFAPDAVVLSAGFDAHRDDPLADMRLSTEFFGWMSRRMLELADRHCNGRLLSLLEGGYDLQALPRCIAEHLLELLGRPEEPDSSAG